jgi:tetratricopeptide (TPR) repeat protein
MAKRKQEEVVYQEETTTTIEPTTGSTLNTSMIAYVLGGLAFLLAAWFAYREFMVKPKNQEAIAASWKAQQYFEKDSFALALASPMGDYEGFESLADNFGNTLAGQSAKYSAGVCHLNLGNFDKAIEYLDDYSTDDVVLNIMKHGMLGDCYAEKGDLEKALSQYGKASGAGENEIVTAYYLKKAGMLSEQLGKTADAAKFYQKIKSKFPMSPVGSDIDKYLARVGVTN